MHAHSTRVRSSLFNINTRWKAYLRWSHGYGVNNLHRGSLDSHRLSYTRDHHVRNEHTHRSLGSTLVYKIKSREVGDTHIKFCKAVWTLSKLELNLHGVADPHRKGQLRHTTSGIISPDTIVEKPLALRVVTLCGCHYN